MLYHTKVILYLGMFAHNACTASPAVFKVNRLSCSLLINSSDTLVLGMLFLFEVLEFTAAALVLLEVAMSVNNK